jgi:coatomer protein complex subunit alpha (xenin)
MWSKSNIFLASAAKLEEECSVMETTRVKSGGWDQCGVFIYTTATHIKVSRCAPLCVRFV